MMPLAKLNTAPVTSSQPPQMISAARLRSVRAARPLGDGQRDDGDQRGRQQPGDLAAVERVEQPADPGGAAEVRAAAAPGPLPPVMRDRPL